MFDHCNPFQPIPPFVSEVGAHLSVATYFVYSMDSPSDLPTENILCQNIITEPTDLAHLYTKH
jgi:hypothetical protein